MPYDINVNFTEGSANSTLAEQINFASQLSFRLTMDNQRYPNAQFSVQTVALPEVTATPAPLNTRQRNIFSTPDKLEYGELSLTFLVDEGFLNYQELHDWIVGLVTVQEDRTIKKTRDLTLIVLNSNNNPIREFQFVDAFPTSLSSIPFDITSTDVQYLIGTVSFQYSYFKLI